MDKRVVKPFQRGVALILSLIMLTAMMMAGIALFRKISAGSMIAGNLTFTSSAISAAEQGSETGRTWLTMQTAAGLYGAAAGYFPATCYTNDTHIATDVDCSTAAAPVFGVVLGASLLGAVILGRVPSARMEGLREHV